MNKWNKIASIAVLIPFLFSSIGVLVFNSQCTCTGSQHHSLYITPNSCNKVEKEHNSCCASEKIETALCSSCQSKNKTCGCSDYKVEYLKIKNQFAKEDISTLKAKTIAILVTNLLFDNDLLLEQDYSNLSFFYIDPPSKFTGFDFLIQINQLKIPHIA